MTFVHLYRSAYMYSPKTVANQYQIEYVFLVIRLRTNGQRLDRRDP